jgi:hypothetical protein
MLLINGCVSRLGGEPLNFGPINFFFIHGCGKF